MGNLRYGAAAAALVCCLASATAALSDPTSTYTYDALGRLTSVVDTDATTINYSYDALGNQLQHDTTAGANHAPIANDDVFSTQVSTPKTVMVTLNDTDPDGDQPSVSSVTVAPGHGTAVPAGSKSITYTPAAGYQGIDTFKYKIVDGRGGTSATATVTMDVGVSQAPDAVDDGANTTAGTPVVISPLANDDGHGASLTISAIGTPGKGTATKTNTTVTYTPYSTASGLDTFSYTVTNGTSFDNATIKVQVAGTNDPPLATDNSYSINYFNQPQGLAILPTKTVSPKSDDTDPDGDTLTIISVDGGTNGTPVLNADQTVTYTYKQAVTTAADDDDSFTYTISDSHGHTAAGTVNIHVTITRQVNCPGCGQQ